MSCLVRAIMRLMVRGELSTDRRWIEDYQRENRICSKKKRQQCHFVQYESSHMTSTGIEPEALLQKPNIQGPELYQRGSTNCQN
jgi:hypothetical protein